ncbi:MAG: acyltransferase [Firmicutes bacterium]|nr:acyltransferase [Bacillota bacterium]
MYSDKRKTEISFINVLLCLLVIFIHVSSEPVTVLDKTGWEYMMVVIPWKLSSFVVQGFIFLSGLKLFVSGTDNINYSKYYISKIKNIILPYVIWVFVYYVYFMRKGYFGFSISQLAENILLGNLVSHFYFIVVIVQFYILAPLWIKLIRKTSQYITIIAALMVTVIFGKYFAHTLSVMGNGYVFRYNDRIFTTYLFYWIAGCFAGYYYEDFKKLVMENKVYITVMFAITAVVNAAFSYINLSGIRQIYFLEDMHTFYCAMAILFVFVLGMAYKEKAVKTKPALRLIDGATFGIYLCHILIINIINELMPSFGIDSISGRYLVRIAVVYTLSIGVCLLYRIIKERFLNRALEGKG